MIEEILPYIIDNEVYLKQLMGEDYYNEHYKIK
jgi:hypothetical protein